MSRISLSAGLLITLLVGAILLYLFSNTKPDAATLASSEIGPSTNTSSLSQRAESGTGLPVAKPEQQAQAYEPSNTGIQQIGDQVAVHLQNASLPAALEEITRNSHIGLDGIQTLAGARVSINFDGMRVAEALLRLTEGYDSSFVYGSTEQGAPILRRLTVRARGAGGLEGSSPNLQAEAVDTAINSDDKPASPSLMQALTDTDVAVRQHALEQRLAHGGLLPVELQKYLALQDPSEDVRFIALDTLFSNPRMDSQTITAISMIAQSDSSEKIRTRADQIRQQLEHVQALEAALQSGTERAVKSN